VVEGLCEEPSLEGRRRLSEKLTELFARGHPKLTRRCRFNEDEASYQFRLLESQRETDLATRGMSYPMNPLDLEFLGQCSSMVSMIADCEVARRRGTAIARTPQVDDAEALQVRPIRNVSKPMAEHSGVDEKHSIATPAVGVSDLDIVDVRISPNIGSSAHRGLLQRAIALNWSSVELRNPPP